MELGSDQVALVSPLVEDIWSAVQGPTSLVELAVEQKSVNTWLVEHHFVFCTLLHAILVFSLKSIRPFSLHDTKVLSQYIHLHRVSEKKQSKLFLS